MGKCCESDNWKRVENKSCIECISVVTIVSLFKSHCPRGRQQWASREVHVHQIQCFQTIIERGGVFIYVQIIIVLSHKAAGQPASQAWYMLLMLVHAFLSKGLSVKTTERFSMRPISLYHKSTLEITEDFN